MTTEPMERAYADLLAWLEHSYAMPKLSRERIAAEAHRLYAAACEERVRLLTQAIDGFMRDALVAIAGAVCTPEKGYLEDGGLRLLLRDITELRRMHDHYRKRMQSDEDQLCRIAKAIGRDATGAPESDPTIAGAAIETLTAAQSRIAELEQALAQHRERDAQMKSRLDGVYGALADAGTVVVRTDEPGESVRELVQALAQERQQGEVYRAEMVKAQELVSSDADE